MHEEPAKLAQRYGIALSYRDIWGNEHETAPATLIALLSAMGVAAADAAQIEAALSAHAARRGDRMLPPVLVQSEGAPALCAQLDLPAAFDAATLQWSIDEEGGGQRRGEFVARTLPLCEDGHGAAQGFRARELTLAEVPPPGYHRLALEGDGRIWGAAAQLYALRSERNWGVGDCTDLAALVDLWALHGAGIVGVNPLHALFAHNPAHASPYSPSSRRFLNALYLDVEAIDEFRECESGSATRRCTSRAWPGYRATIRRRRGRPHKRARCSTVRPATARVSMRSMR
jgi:(1->4)-alpha-D-glucan 1-alpha-D-glucosylmutase